MATSATSPYRRPLLIFVALLALIALFVSAAMNGDIVAPVADNEVLTGTFTINVTFDGTANITITWHNGSGETAINTTTEASSPYTYAFDTSTQADAYQYYNLSINLTNSTDESDTELLWRYNLTVDNNAPTASLTAPLTFLRGVYNVQGYANDSTFQNYTIGVYNASMGLIDSFVSVTPVNGTVYAWNTSNGTFDDGSYLLLLTVTDGVGRSGQANFTVYVDNTPLTLDYAEDEGGDTEYNASLTDTIVGYVILNIFANASEQSGVIMALSHGNLCEGLSEPQIVPSNGEDWNITCAISTANLSAIDASDGSVNLTMVANDSRELASLNYTVNWDFERPAVTFSWWETTEWNETTMTGQPITLMEPTSFLANPDIFFSPDETVINFSLNVTDNVGVGSVIVNMTGLGVGSCDGLLALTLDGGTGLYNGSCSLGVFNETNIFVWSGGSPVYSPEGGILFIVNDVYGNSAPYIYNASNTSGQYPCEGVPGPEDTCLPLTVPVVIHDFGVPDMGDTCLQFGAATTDLNTVPDMNAANLVLEIEVNLSCELGNPSMPSEFLTMFLFDFLSVDLSSPAAGAKLAQLVDQIEFEPAEPNAWDTARIYVNSTFFIELNTTTNITLYHLPFVTLPSITPDEGAAGGIVVHTWVTGPDAAFGGMTTGNLTFSVIGFSGYTVEDDAVPVITFDPLEPIPIESAWHDYNSSIGVNVTVNGTGTQLSQVLFYVDGEHVANYSNLTGSNTANCTYTAPGSEVAVCYFILPDQTDGNKTLSVVAYDYGGDAPGNNANGSVNVGVDTTPPVVTITAPSTGYATPNYSITGTVSDADIGVKNVTISINGTVVGIATVTGGTWNYTRVSAEGNVENITANASDLLLQSSVATLTNVIIDGTDPVITSISSGTPTASGATITWTTDEVANTTVNYGTTTALGTRSGSASYVTSHSQALSGLSASTTYDYNVTSCDRAGNCVTNGTNSFTTAAAGSGGGGGGDSAFTLPGLSANGQRLTLTRYGGVQSFTLAGRAHTIRILRIEAESVTFRFQSDPMDVTLKPGESKNVDVNGDGVADIYVELVSFSDAGVTFILGLARESTTTPATPVPVTTPTTAPVMTETGEELADVTQGDESELSERPAESAPAQTVADTAPAESPARSAWPWVLFVVIVLLILVIWWMVKTKRITVD